MIDVRKFVETLEGKPVAVFGLGISNIAAVKALAKSGAAVTAWDDNEDNRVKAQESYPAIFMKDLMEDDLGGYGCLVLAPGVPLNLPEPHPVVKKAREAGLEIICDLEILHRCHHGRPVIGITGTNGKSTTTALTGHILNECGIPAAIGGNIGKAVLDLDLPSENGAFVFEISSFQADLCRTFAPDISVHLNLTKDHLDRHGTMEGYAEAKMRIFRGSGKAVIGVDDEWSKKMFDTIEKSGDRECFPVSVKTELKDGVYVHDGKLYEAMFAEPAEICEMKMPALLGLHNHQNAAMAYAAARLIGLEPDAIIKAMENFPGLNHRQFLVRTINGVAYINDSKATNAAATSFALASYKNIYWIVGGRPKEGGLDGLEPYVEHIRHAFLIGESSDDFASWLENHGVTHSFCVTLDKAVTDAHQQAQGDRGQPGGTGTVLLSPACASFDQFKSFEERGNIYSDLVNALPDDS